MEPFEDEAVHAWLACRSANVHLIVGKHPALRVCCAVVKLHQVLRDSVGMMAIGVEVPRSDTVAEQGDAGPSAVPGGTGGKAAAKDLGDVRCGQTCRAADAVVLADALLVCCWDLRVQPGLCFPTGHLGYLRFEQEQCREHGGPSVLT